jgi:predicted HicB family RNase H-like nuclease
MKPEYDFSNAERGKFFRQGALSRLPVYLEPEVQDYLAAKAQAKNIDLNDLVNDLLKREIQLAESLR